MDGRYNKQQTNNISFFCLHIQSIDECLVWSTHLSSWALCVTISQQIDWWARTITLESLIERATFSFCTLHARAFHSSSPVWHKTHTGRLFVIRAAVLCCAVFCFHFHFFVYLESELGSGSAEQRQQQQQIGFQPLWSRCFWINHRRLTSDGERRRAKDKRKDKRKWKTRKRKKEKKHGNGSSQVNCTAGYNAAPTHSRAIQTASVDRGKEKKKRQSSFWWPFEMQPANDAFLAFAGSLRALVVAEWLWRRRRRRRWLLIVNATSQ